MFLHPCLNVAVIALRASAMPDPDIAKLDATLQQLSHQGLGSNRDVGAHVCPCSRGEHLAQVTQSAEFSENQKRKPQEHIAFEIKGMSSGKVDCEARSN